MDSGTRVHREEERNFVCVPEMRELMDNAMRLIGQILERRVLRLQIEASLNSGLPYIFHVREAYEDFWPIFDNFPSLRGVLHSFTADTAVLEQAIFRELLIGLNGIMTFTNDQKQITMAKSVPLELLLLETDAPYLTPKPFRGKVCKSEYVRKTAEFLAGLRGETLEHLADQTTANAHKLFKL